MTERTYRIAQALGAGVNVYDPEGRLAGWSETPGEAGEQIRAALELASRPELCLEVGTTDDGERWACCHPKGHVRYWFNHVALTTDPARPVVMWRRNDGDLACYLTPVERSANEEENRP